MKPFEYGDEEIGSRELGFAVTSTIIGTGALSMPRVIATETLFSDGWVILLVSGLICACLGWGVTRVAILFPKQNFVQYTSTHLTKPVAYTFSIILVLTFAALTAYEARTISIIAQTYLFSDTPVQLLSFFFLLVVIYGVNGSRAALLRLNVLFLPIVVVAILLLSLLNVNLMEIDSLLPAFQTDVSQYAKGLKNSIFTFIGFEVALFYAVMLNRTEKKAPMAVAKAVMLTVMSYILIYITCISVFTYMTTKGLTYPTIELGKEIEIGGGFLERFDAIFFTTWIITIYNTTAMYYDVAALLFCAMFPKVKKHIFIFVSAPIIFMVNMVPGNLDALSNYGTYLAWVDMGCIVLAPLLVFIVYKIKRRGGQSETSS
ncbi:spore gernimation protein GerLB [Bacillus clarus]|uniref:Spore germination family protein n=1 Tax=Bacillus clarus TaxID=2338372 RepID=A0A090YVY9_9BACI|nr:endospore germination permease [Bacillus clarus]KFN02088.1 spore germination family protein [Bacillus clarus]RFT63002.1 spore gernimation protein GerLB [Bacillus clarus]